MEEATDTGRATDNTVDRAMGRISDSGTTGIRKPSGLESTQEKRQGQISNNSHQTQTRDRADSRADKRPRDQDSEEEPARVRSRF